MTPVARLVLMVAVLAGVVYGQTNSASSLTPFAKGILEKVDPANRQLTVRIGDQSHQFQWTDRTYVFRGKEKITPQQLKLGDIVALRVDRGPGGEWLIRRMKTYPAPTP